MRQAVESYAADVRQVADETARASDVATFAAALREAGGVRRRRPGVRGRRGRGADRRERGGDLPAGRRSDVRPSRPSADQLAGPVEARRRLIGFVTCPTPSSTLWAARVPDALQTWIENETVITWSPRNPRVQLLWQALTDDTITAANR